MAKLPDYLALIATDNGVALLEGTAERLAHIPVALQCLWRWGDIFHTRSLQLDTQEIVYKMEKLQLWEKSRAFGPC